MNISKLAATLFLVSTIPACATLPSHSNFSASNDVEESLIWSSNEERPEWTMEEPDVKNKTMSFVGLSATHATEKGARKDARRNAVDNISSYIGTLAKDKFENAYLSYGLDSSILDPTSGSRQFGKQLTANIVSRVKTKKWYSEKWSTESGIGYRVFVLAKIPEDALNESYKNAANRLSNNAKNMAAEAANASAKKQAEMAVEFWNQMEEQGLIE